jgi:hypothetical protein
MTGVCGTACNPQIPLFLLRNKVGSATGSSTLVGVEIPSFTAKTL